MSSRRCTSRRFSPATAACSPSSWPGTGKAWALRERCGSSAPNMLRGPWSICTVVRSTARRSGWPSYCWTGAPRRASCPRRPLPLPLPRRLRGVKAEPAGLGLPRDPEQGVPRGWQTGTEAGTGRGPTVATTAAAAAKAAAGGRRGGRPGRAAAARAVSAAAVAIATGARMGGAWTGEAGAAETTADMDPPAAVAGDATAHLPEAGAAIRTALFRA